MSDTTAQVIKYLDEDGLKLLYSRLNDRYRIVDALPDISSLTAPERKVMYVLRTMTDGMPQYLPYVVVGGSEWVNLGSTDAAVALKADKVRNAKAGNVAALDAEGNLVDGGLPPGNFVAMTSDRAEYGRATDLRDTWGAYMSGMNVVLLDNKDSGVTAQLSEIGYLWVEGTRFVNKCIGSENNRPTDGTVHGYYMYSTGVFYEDPECTVPIQGIEGELYLNLASGRGHGKVYRYDGVEFTMVQRYVQFVTSRTVQGDDPTWENCKTAKTLFFRMVEPLNGFSPDTFQTVEIGSGNAQVKYVGETMLELYRLMSNGDLGWCSGNDTLYYMIGSALKPVSPGGGGGGTTVIKGTPGQIETRTEIVEGVEVVTVSLAQEAVEAQVPKPMMGDEGKVLTVNEEGEYVWETPIVQEIRTVEL